MTNPSPSNAAKVSAPPAKPVMLFDGDCGFCRRWIARWNEATDDAVEYIPYQHESVPQRFPEISRDAMAGAVHLVSADGSVYHGADAVFRALALPRGHHWTVWAYQNLPGFAPVSEFWYRIVARHRTFFSRLTRLLWGPGVQRPSYYLVRSIFVRGVALVYLIAFLSLYVQVPGLIGENGILTPNDMMSSLRQTADQQQVGLKRYFLFPTFCWIGASEASLRLQAGAGAGLAVLAMVGLAPALCLALCWALYLSLSVVSGVFLGYQWDALLLETGFLAIFFAPLLWLRNQSGLPPSRAVLWLLRWLLFRFMFMSGCVKLLSHDPAWHNLTALAYHYETQPLPTSIAWHAHHLPLGFHKFSVAVMFFVELVLPFLILFPRRLRFVAGGAFVLLQIGIAVTGNYTFFNLLTVVLCILLLDDAAVRALIPKQWQTAAKGTSQTTASSSVLIVRTRRIAITVVAVLVLLVSGMLTYARFRGSFDPPKLLARLYNVAAPLRSINNYGLFAIMTTNRPEIIIEGSNDGQTWHAYEFKYKPSALDRRPGFVAPHQPRLDWQMWFAALGTYRDNPWFMRFCEKLLRGSPQILQLLDKNPFPQAPPKYLRATLYNYHFTTPAERRKTGHWWKRERIGDYCPVLSLK
ncbi:MAG: lipase maturation factor family protein [Verrucomicrobia subdivision 3 bacterium]|nr:lipase maturation factor family protein [Limisphaerales bacterium]